MPETIHVKPAPGLTVRDPKTYQTLPPEGAQVERSSHWLRRIESGDVVLVTKKPARQGGQ